MADLISMLAAAAGAAAGGGEVDPNFNQTVLLLHGDGTDGSQNNTFVDSSTNNFTITRNGNTTQGTFSPFSAPDGRWSNYFDGTGDYLTAGSASDWSFLHNGASFTIEAWIYFQRPSSLPASYVILNNAQTTAETGIQFFVRESTSKLEFQILRASSGNYAVALVSTATIAENTWTHVAVSLDGSDEARLFINGSLDTQATASNFSATTAPYTLNIGRYPHTNVNFWTGYISNLRIVDGSALYTSTFTPSTTPLTVVSGASLLTCQSNRFVDNSSNAFAITRNGDVKVTPFSPFAPTAAYSASVNGGSGYFDGSGDYLNVADNAAWDFGSGDFCVEAWVYIAGNSAQNGSGVRTANIIGTESNTSPVDSYDGWLILISGDASTTGTGINFIRRVAGGSPTSVTYTATITQNAWHHIAVTRESSSLRMFFNGSVVASDISFSGNVNSSGDPLKIAYRGTISTFEQYLNGYLSNVRIVKGSAVYTSAFTPSTTPLTAITNTELLLNYTNAGIFDNTGKNNLETVGNAQIDTTTKKYGTGSMEFDGTGDYLAIPTSQDFAFGTGDFTFECWINTSNVPSGNSDRIIRIGANAVTGNFQVLVISSQVIRVDSGVSALITGSVDVVDGAFHHIAVTRSGTDLKLFVDGTQDGSTAINSTNFNQTVAQIGYDSTVAGSEYTGFIDDLRITKGVARYTSAFTPPTKAFPDL